VKYKNGAKDDSALARYSAFKNREEEKVFSLKTSSKVIGANGVLTLKTLSHDFQTFKSWDLKNIFKRRHPEKGIF